MLLRIPLLHHAVGHDPAAAVDLQEQRHTADYDPLPRFTVREAELAIELGETAAKRLRDATTEDCKIFLTLSDVPAPARVLTHRRTAVDAPLGGALHAALLVGPGGEIGRRTSFRC